MHTNVIAGTQPITINIRINSFIYQTAAIIRGNVNCKIAATKIVVASKVVVASKIVSSTSTYSSFWLIE